MSHFTTKDFRQDDRKIEIPDHDALGIHEADTPSGKDWDEDADDLAKQYPMLWARYGWE